VEQSGVEGRSCVAIEDSERGLLSATQAGVRCIVVPSRLTRAGQFVGAESVVGSVSEIPSALSAITTSRSS
jgi:beta-phosphoglucomutase-like phosphatase (HAD superfamily)